MTVQTQTGNNRGDQVRPSPAGYRFGLACLPLDHIPQKGFGDQITIELARHEPSQFFRVAARLS